MQMWSSYLLYVYQVFMNYKPESTKNKHSFLTWSRAQLCFNGAEIAICWDPNWEIYDYNDDDEWSETQL